MILAVAAIIGSHSFQVLAQKPLDTIQINQIDIGYELVDSRSWSGAISTVNETYRSSSPNIQILQSLQGRIAGANITQASGQPAGEFVVRVRGVHSIAAGNEPLYVIDGFPLYSDNFLASSGVVSGPQIDALSTFSPGDIESITILKDAASKAIYGARGANGVIIINTRKGSIHTPSIELNIFGGIQQSIGKYDLLNGADFAQYLNETRTNAGLSPIYRNPESFGTGTNWQDETFRSSAAVQNYQLRFTGASETLRFMISGTYTDQQGIVSPSRFQRFNLQANLQAQISDKFTLMNSFKVSRTEGSTVPSSVSSLQASPGVSGAAFIFNPLLNVKDLNGNYIVENHAVGNDGQPLDELQTNYPLLSPVAQGKYTQSDVQNTRFFNNLSLDFSLLDNLVIRISAGLDAQFNEEALFASEALNPASPGNGFGASAKLQNFNWVNEYTLRYEKPMGTEGMLHGLAGFSMQGFTSELLSGQSIGFENESLGYHNLRVGQNKSINSNLFESQLVSFFTRWRYSINDKYNFTLTGRADGASQFNGNYAFYPAASFGWNLSNEDFMSDVHGISDVFVRVSYGSSGNNNILPYSTLSILRQFETNVNGTLVKGFRPVTLQNSDLEMEQTNEFNIGVNFVILNRRVGVSLDYFNQKTNNAIMFLPQPGTSGYEFVLANGATIANSGFDFSIDVKILDANTKWSAAVDAAIHKNNIDAIEGNLDITTGTPLRGIAGWSLLSAGNAIGSFYGYETDGIVQTGDDINSIPKFPGQNLQPGDRKYKDNNGDGIIDKKDKSVIGNALPRFTLGLHNTIIFKFGMDINFFFQGAFGHEIANFNSVEIENLDGQSNITQEAYDGRWTTDSGGNNYPRALYTENSQRIFSDAIVENGSYLRLKSFSLGYSFSNSFAGNLAMSKLRVYVTATNILTFTDYKGIDPDVSHFGQNATEAGVDFDNYPNSKQFLAGIQISF